MTLTAFPQQQADISELLPGEVQKGLFKLDLNAAAQKELFSLQVHCVKGSKKEAVAWHWLFLILVFVLEGLFHAYVAWMVIKSVFWLWIVWKLLPGLKNWSYQFRPLLQDPRKHFGLFELHRPYNYIMLQMLIGAFVLALAFASNVAKEVSGDLGAELHSFLGTVLIAVSIFIPGTLVFFGPMFYFDRRMSGLQQKFVQRLDARLAKDQDQKQVIAIEAEKYAISSQTCWPHENKQFKFLAVAILIFVAMPVLLSLPHVPKQVESYLSAVKLCQSFMHAVADWFYSLTQA